jgi:urease gamma subunit
MRLILLLSMAALLAEARKERNGRKKAKKESVAKVRSVYTILDTRLG